MSLVQTSLFCVTSSVLIPGKRRRRPEFGSETRGHPETLGLRLSEASCRSFEEDEVGVKPVSSQWPLGHAGSSPVKGIFSPGEWRGAEREGSGASAGALNLPTCTFCGWRSPRTEVVVYRRQLLTDHWSRWSVSRESAGHRRAEVKIGRLRDLRSQARGYRCETGVSVHRTTRTPMFRPTPGWTQVQESTLGIRPLRDLKGTRSKRSIYTGGRKKIVFYYYFPLSLLQEGWTGEITREGKMGSVRYPTGEPKT